MVCGLSAIATKIILVLLVASTTAFLIATIVLAIEYNDIQSSIDGTTTAPPTPPPTKPPPPDAKIDYRLPGNIIPSAYRLQFGGADLMNSRAEIDFHTLEDTNELILQASDMRVIFVNVYRKDNLQFGNHVVDVDTFELDAERGFLVVKMKQVLNAGRDYYINIAYFQSVTDTRRTGLYKAYTEAESSGSEMIIANFQPIYARYAIPCFDEPTYKTTFTLTVAYPNSSNIISNMMIRNTTEKPDFGQTEVTFEESLPMSTYQLGLFVSEFVTREVTIQPNFGQNIDLKIHAIVDAIANTNYTLDLGVKIINYFVDFFEEAYPLTKLDLVAIPGYSSLGGGGLGLLLLDDKSLIFDEQNDPTDTKQRFTLNFARELVQLWFGDMVTQKWWNDMWLYEGLSTYLAYQAVDSIYPDWGVMDDFLINELQPAFDADFELRIDPVAGPAETPEEILSKFDELSVKKSASLIRMYAYKLGQDNFRTACKQFLNDSIYQSQPAYKFIDELSIASGQGEVKVSSDVFIRNTGFPVLDVEKQVRENVTVFVLTQNRTQEVRRYLPLSYKYENSTSISQGWLSDVPGGYSIAVDKESTWMKFNVDQRSYNRISYDTDAWSALVDALEGDNYEELSIADRASLINDAFFFSYVFQLSSDVPLNLIKTLRKDMNFVPWHVGSTALMKMKTAFQEAEYSVDLQKFVQGIIKEAYNYVGWTPDSNHLKNKLRMLILELACKFEYDQCLTEAKTYFDQWNYVKENRPNADIRQLVYSVGIATMEAESSWDNAFEKFKAESDPKEKLMLLKALAQTKSTDIVQKYLILVGNVSEVPSEFHLPALRAIAENPIGLPIVWRHMQQNWNDLTSAHGLTNPELNNLLIFIVKQFYTEVRFNEAFQFILEHPDIPNKTHKAALLGLALNDEWFVNANDEIGMWLKINSK